MRKFQDFSVKYHENCLQVDVDMQLIIINNNNFMNFLHDLYFKNVDISGTYILVSILVPGYIYGFFIIKPNSAQNLQFFKNTLYRINIYKENQIVVF